ncbi:hypothetical protein FKW77_007734 [Venturia effusa]|uniref:Uncharacterized protein n=1 Tax=Venturia effusa TaxID=50376 RepID=A0A517LCM4_9PEZI|nr:hypothetical protein FKW77_007734 [Venturia effusa]
MKATTALLFFILALTAAAKKHRLCCCAEKNDCGFLTCNGTATQSVIDNSNGKFVRATKLWDKGQGAPIGGPQNWMYAKDPGQGDDGYLGGNEVSDLCGALKKESKCFSPKNNLDYHNGDNSAGTDHWPKPTPSPGDDDTWPGCMKSK